MDAAVGKGWRNGLVEQLFKLTLSCLCARGTRPSLRMPGLWPVMLLVLMVGRVFVVPFPCGLLAGLCVSVAVLTGRAH